jgi:hypothetical protein
LAAIQQESQRSSEPSSDYQECFIEFQKLVGCDTATALKHVNEALRQYLMLAAAAIAKDVIARQHSGREYRAFVDFCEQTFGMIRGEAARILLALSNELKK